jgi:broad specificity phosphatase PhoE
VLRRVFLIRHCQSEANRDARAEARGDSPLTPLGVDQARRRAKALADHDLATAAVVASPQLRAAHTAGEIARHHGWTLSHDQRLQEGDLGRLEGLSYQEVMEQVPPGAIWVSADVHGGESMETVGGRMLEALAEALDSSPGTLVVVSHGYAISALLHSLGHDAGFLANGDMLELHLDEAAAVQRLERHPLTD